MHSESVEEIKMAQRLYYLAIKYEKRVPKGIIIFSRNICDGYTKKAKKMNIKLSCQELIEAILK